MQRTLSIAHLTAIDLSPPELVRLGAHHGLDAVGVRVYPATATESRYPMTPGSDMVRATQQACERFGIEILDIEVFGLAPDIDRETWLPVLKVGEQLGASILNVVGNDPELDRFQDKLGQLVMDAEEFGIRASMEPISYQSLASFKTAHRIASVSGAGIMVDTLHLFRSGTTLSELATLPPEMVTVVQLCDGLWSEPTEFDESVDMPLGQSVGGSPREFEARAYRRAPGEGEFPLKEVLDLFPNTPVSIEIPDVRRVRAAGLTTHLNNCIARTRALME